MDIFKFNNPTASTKMEQGEVINDITSKLWIERYAEAGEFALIAPVKTGIRNKLPIGSFISHVDSQEIMIVENHEINDTQGRRPEIVLTGRGFETFFENRVVGSNKTFPVSGTLTDFSLGTDFSYNQAVLLIRNHIDASILLDDNYALPFVSVLSTASVGTSATRKSSRGTLYDRLLELLAIDDLGIKIIRPGASSPLGGSNPNVAVIIHNGTDRSSSVIFSHDTGEIINADYLWSNKKKKNAAMISGKWVETVVNPSEIQYSRRMMFVNGTDIDDRYTTVPTGATLTSVIAEMQQRGLEALASQNDVALTKAEVSKKAIKSVYRRDFDLGDFITVSGDYNEFSTMRINEFVEIEDSTGESGYPTLTAI